MVEDKEILKEYPLTQDYIDFNRYTRLHLSSSVRLLQNAFALTDHHIYRLNLQHYLWRDLFGYTLHPKIPCKQQSLKVADVGTGTGIWLLDLSARLDPSTEFLGLDTNISQVGPQEWLPTNMKLQQWDASTEVPHDLIEQFDIVHLRLFGFIIRDDPRIIMRSLIKMLKPGGYLQWSEADVESWHIKTVSPDVPTDALTALWRQSVPEGSRLLPTWVKGLPNAFEAEGLLDVEADWREGEPHTTLAIHWCNLHLYEMIARKLRPTNPEKANEIEGLLLRAAAESRKGGMFSFKRVNVVGRKPE
ncbi:MAG: hypothetical protein M1820_009176 [Bogoriella megaspora]|nr:MAG: hypothetical protein M1820_009176 [Bogoriella megaspora]